MARKKSLPVTLLIYFAQQTVQQRAVKSWIESDAGAPGKKERQKSNKRLWSEAINISGERRLPTFCPATEDKEVFNILSGIIQFPVDGVTMGPVVLSGATSQNRAWNTSRRTSRERESAPLALTGFSNHCSHGCETPAGCDKSPCRLAHAYIRNHLEKRRFRPLAFSFAKSSFCRAHAPAYPRSLGPAKQVI